MTSTDTKAHWKRRALRAGTIKPSEAAELANIAGKMIKSAKVQVEYYALRKEAPTIPFLRQDDES